MLLESLTNDVISGNSGVLFGLNVAADKTFAGGDIVISGIKVSTPKGTEYVVGGELKYKAIADYLDPSGDGVWDVDDVKMVIPFIMNDEVDSNVDFNADGVVDVDDVKYVIGRVLND